MPEFQLPEMRPTYNGKKMRVSHDWRFIKEAIPNISKSEYAFLCRAYTDGPGTYRRKSKRFEYLNTIVQNHLENQASE
jgi:hypothetical protein